MKRIFQYLQVNKYKGLMFNPSKKLVLDFYDDADFAELWGYENTKDPIFVRSRIKAYRVERMDIGNIPLTRWCRWNMKM